MKVTVSTLTCKRCGHSWLPRRPQQPKICPICKRTTWNVPKKVRAA